MTAPANGLLPTLAAAVFCTTLRSETVGHTRRDRFRAVATQFHFSSSALGDNGNTQNLPCQLLPWQMLIGGEVVGFPFICEESSVFLVAATKSVRNSGKLAALARKSNYLLCKCDHQGQV